MANAMHSDLEDDDYDGNTDVYANGTTLGEEEDDDDYDASFMSGNASSN
jgi:hypothetical protein